MPNTPPDTKLAILQYKNKNVFFKFPVTVELMYDYQLRVTCVTMSKKCSWWACWNITSQNFWMK